MLQLKSCPRCQGDVHKTGDWFGEYMTCLQCGWSKDIAADPTSRLAETRESFAATVKKAS